MGFSSGIEGKRQLQMPSFRKRAEPLRRIIPFLAGDEDKLDVVIVAWPGAKSDKPLCSASSTSRSLLNISVGESRRPMVRSFCRFFAMSTMPEGKMNLRKPFKPIRAKPALARRRS